jgi:ribonuclease-3
MFEVDVYINGIVYGTGTGSSKQAATKQAAAKALENLHLTD